MIDVNDVLAVVGLAALAVGVYLAAGLATALVVVGVVLLTLAVVSAALGAWRRGPGPGAG